MQTKELFNFKTFDKKIMNQLTNIVGKSNIITDLEGIYANAFDCAHIPFHSKNPIIVVYPENTQQVSEIVKLANKNSIPIVERVIILSNTLLQNSRMFLSLL